MAEPVASTVTRQSGSLDTAQYSWVRRRRFMYAIATFCALVVCYCLVRDLNSQVAETAVTLAFLTMAAMVGSYTFGATWQDVEIIRKS